MPGDQGLGCLGRRLAAGAATDDRHAFSLQQALPNDEPFSTDGYRAAEPRLQSAGLDPQSEDHAQVTRFGRLGGCGVFGLLRVKMLPCSVRDRFADLPLGHAVEPVS